MQPEWIQTSTGFTPWFRANTVILCKLLILLVRTKYGADFALNKRVTQEHFYRKNYV